MGSAAMDPKMFMVQALQKCLLNNKHIIKMIDEKNKSGINQRVINSIQLIEEMDLTLNKSEDNEAVNLLVSCFDWIKIELDEIVSHWESDVFLYKNKVNSINPVLNNLLEAFKVMED